MPAPRLWFTPLHNAEWTHALAQHVFCGKLSPAEVQQMHARLDDDKAVGRWLSVAMPEHAFDLCADLAPLWAETRRAHSRQPARRLRPRTQSRTILDFRRAPGQAGKSRRVEDDLKRFHIAECGASVPTTNEKCQLAFCFVFINSFRHISI